MLRAKPLPPYATLRAYATRSLATNLTNATNANNANNATNATTTPPRKQAFKDHLHKLHASDPTLWTDRTLSRFFNLTIENTQALLALRSIETSTATPLDQDLVDLAYDIDDLLDDDDPAADAREAERMRRLVAALDSAEVPDTRLERMSDEQEYELARAFFERFSTEDHADIAATVSSLLESLSEEDRSALELAVGGAPASDETTDGLTERSTGGDETAADAPNLQRLLADSPGDLLELLRALPAKPPSDPVHGREFTLTSRTLPEKAGIREVLRAGVSSANPRGKPKFATVDDLGPDAEKYLKRGGGSQTQTVSQVDSADQLAHNLERRREALVLGKKPLHYKGQYIFTELKKGKGAKYGEGRGKEPVAVWVHDKRRGTRDATDDEKKRALQRTQPPILSPRLKRIL